MPALQAYYDVFFAEDEMRIEPALREAQERAQELARSLPFPELLEELSQGVKLERTWQAPEVVLVPTFWGSPLLYFSDVTPTRRLLAYGGRPSTASIVPGEVIPDALFQALKALADPTRLRILRFLMQEPLTPAELARRLRLRRLQLSITFTPYAWPNSCNFALVNMVGSTLFGRMALKPPLAPWGIFLNNLAVAIPVLTLF
ncbi:MAG: winged helix-turn-helix transcriptional regulator [Chloroflexi bacterium]|nr:winged helix-turn-helix transcriptional regulator [Chloroflexota bacterium]